MFQEHEFNLCRNIGGIYYLYDVYIYSSVNSDEMSPTTVSQQSALLSSMLLSVTRCAVFENYKNEKSLRDRIINNAIIDRYFY